MIEEGVTTVACPDCRTQPGKQNTFIGYSPVTELPIHGVAHFRDTLQLPEFRHSDLPELGVTFLTGQTLQEAGRKSATFRSTRLESCGLHANGTEQSTPELQPFSSERRRSISILAGSVATQSNSLTMSVDFNNSQLRRATLGPVTSGFWPWIGTGSKLKAVTTDSCVLIGEDFPEVNCRWLSNTRPGARPVSLDRRRRT